MAFVSKKEWLQLRERRRRFGKRIPAASTLLMLGSGGNSSKRGMEQFSRYFRERRARKEIDP